ncbi:ParM/StbA family protein [Marinobacter halodurans]|uniref:ParM/StbA family protein n=1 Tax=Marinobacter halodurans TaxID=2528979 RepID=A0ABY1ZRG3_9GAMM|nr:ParM/StbA family protein [Marinobacter halodurans]TBW57455.1 ParM/StbA family protein [Marinobacter halodurans]
MSNQKIFNYVDDNGFYNHKIAFFDRNNNIQCLKYRTQIGTSQEAQTSMDGELANMYEVEDGARFVCDEAVQRPIDIRSADYAKSVENRVLVNHGLAKAGCDGTKVRLSTSLPFRDYFLSDGTRNHALIEAQAENMKHSVYRAHSKGRDEKPIAEVHSSRVFCEGVCAMMDFIIGDDGTPVYEEDEIMAPMAVLDFGGSTFDVVGISQTFNILQDSSGTLERGTLDMRESLANKLGEYFKSEGVPIEKPPHWMIDQAMATDQVKTFVRGEKKVFNVREIRRAAAEPVVGEIKRFVRAKLGDLGSYQFVLLVGGGALLCQDLFEDWTEEFGLIVRDEFANARGMLKHATYLDSVDG